jgi:hypothetical protein
VRVSDIASTLPPGSLPVYLLARTYGLKALHPADVVNEDLLQSLTTGYGPSRKPPWPPVGSGVWGRPAAGALAPIRRS